MTTGRRLIFPPLHYSLTNPKKVLFNCYKKKAHRKTEFLTKKRWIVRIKKKHRICLYNVNTVK